MKKSIMAIIALLALLVSLAAAQETTKNRDEAFKKQIIGSWVEGNGIATFNADGSYEAKGYRGSTRTELVVRAEGKWWIENGRLFNTVHKVEPQSHPVPNKVYIDIIVSISDDVMTLVDEKGKQYTKRRDK